LRSLAANDNIKVDLKEGECESDSGYPKTWPMLNFLYWRFQNFNFYAAG